MLQLKYTLKRGSVDSAALSSMAKLPTFYFHFAQGFPSPEDSHRIWTPWSVFQDGSMKTILSASRSCSRDAQLVTNQWTHTQLCCLHIQINERKGHRPRGRMRLFVLSRWENENTYYYIRFENPTSNMLSIPSSNPCRIPSTDADEYTNDSYYRFQV